MAKHTPTRFNQATTNLDKKNSFTQRRNHWWVGLGGTFDHFHRGHEAFLEFAARQGENLIIGVTADHFVTGKPYSESLEPYAVRARHVRNWCKKHRINHEVVMLDDLYGPTLEDRRIKALAVTEETVAGAEKINEVRGHSRLPELPIYICPLVRNELGQPLHAEQIRAGLFDKDGRSFEKAILVERGLNDEQREALAQPLGDLVEDETTVPTTPGTRIVLVGDQTLQLFLENKWPFNVAVIDELIERQPLSAEHKNRLAELEKKPELSVQKVVNLPGQISSELLTAVKNALHSDSGLANQDNHKQLIKVTGEEDLATAATILLAPLGTVIFYGQPGVGLVKVDVNLELKNKLRRIFERPETID